METLKNNRQGKYAIAGGLRVRVLKSLCLPLVGGVILFGGALLVGAPMGIVSGEWAEASDTTTVANLQFGQITAKRGNETQIDGKTYVLDAQVTITDNEGRTLDSKSLAPGR